MDFTVKEIIDLCNMAGISIDQVPCDDELETEVTVQECEGKKYAWCTEYPEEGSIELG